MNNLNLNLLVLDKAQATQINNKYRYNFENLRIQRWKLKKVYFPNISQTSQNNTSIIKLNNTPQIIYCDSTRIDSYQERGTREKPYKNLNTALIAKLVEGATITYLFKLAPGEYIGTCNLNMNTQTQSFIIWGSGIDKTIIKGSDNWDNTTLDILGFRDFKNITIKDCTIKNGKYGFYPRDCDLIKLSHVKFQFCGSIGTENRHDLSGSQQDQDAYWTGTSTNSGGACRIRNCIEVNINSVEVEYCLRGLRIQDVNSTKNNSISNCKIYRCLESGIYLASNTYTGDVLYGCNNFKISNNHIESCFNNSILCIGGKNNIITNNCCINGANAGIQTWHALNTIITNNTVYNCNRKSYNGLGVLGDAYGSICIDGNQDIGTGEYIAIISNNNILNCNQGRAQSIIGLNILCAAYPNNQPITNNSNISDATNKFVNTNNITISSVNLDAMGGGGLTHPAELTSSTTSTLLKLENTNSAGEIEFILSDIDPTGDTQDMRWRFQTDTTNNKMDLHAAYFQNHVNKTENIAMSIAKNGNISFHGYNSGQTANLNSYNTQFKGTVGFHNNVDFLGTTNIGTYFKFFPNAITTHQDSGPISNAFDLSDLPSHRNYKLIYGDGLQAYSNQVFGVRIRLPFDNLIDGDSVELFSNHNFTHTGPENVIFISWNSDGGETDFTRKIIESDTEYTITQGDNTNGELKVESFTNGTSRGVIKYNYISSINTWIYERSSY